MICDIYIRTYLCLIMSYKTAGLLKVVLGCYCSSDSVTENTIETDHTQVCMCVFMNTEIWFNIRSLYICWLWLTEVM